MPTISFRAAHPFFQISVDRYELLVGKDVVGVLTHRLGEPGSLAEIGERYLRFPARENGRQAIVEKEVIIGEITSLRKWEYISRCRLVCEGREFLWEPSFFLTRCLWMERGEARLSMNLLTGYARILEGTTLPEAEFLAVCGMQIYLCAHDRLPLTW